MADSEFIVLPLKGAKDIMINRDEVVVNTVAPLKMGLDKVVDDHDIYKRYPKEEVPEEERDTDGKIILDEDGNPKLTGNMRKENEVEWLNRVGALLDKQYQRGEDESDEDFDARIQKLSIEDHFVMVAYDFIKVVCEVFHKPTPSYEVVGTVPVGKLRKFCYDILQEARIHDPRGIFFPSR